MSVFTRQSTDMDEPNHTENKAALELPPQPGRGIEVYAAAGFMSELVPIIPPYAAVSAASNHPEAVEKGKGKIPGLRRGDGWVGFGGFTKHVASEHDIGLWSAWGGGVGLQGRRFPGVDIDVDDPELADAIEESLRRNFGDAPVRFGRGARRLLPYAGEGFKKRRLAFRKPGLQEGADPLAVEFLATGQQYVVEGVHQKTGKPYWWRDGVGPVDVGAQGLTRITAEQVEAFFADLDLLLMMRGYEVVQSTSAAREGSAAIMQVNLRAPSLDAVADALRAIPNDYDYDGWLRVAVAVKAATGGSEEGFELFDDWSSQWAENTPEVNRAKWESLRAPFKLGWTYLSQLGRERSDTFSAAAHEFTAPPSNPSPDPPPSARDLMLSRSVWVEQQRLVFDLQDLSLRGSEQFNWLWREVGPTSNRTKCAWAVFGDAPERRTVRSITYRPGLGPIVYEEHVRGDCVNMWRGGEALPTGVSDADVRLYLDHLSYLFGDAPEVGVFLDWQASLLQNPALKPNFGVVVGSEHQGNGKSILMKVLRAGLGAHNVANVTAEDLAGGFNGWASEAKVFVVEEMHTFERRATMNKLKGLLTTPPDTFIVNPKFGKQYATPNVLAGVFLTNHRDALAIERGDRRFLVLWTHSPPREAAYYDRLVSWLDDGGAALVAGWLMARDLSSFNASARAPDTPAKEEMRVACLSALDEWVESELSQGAETGQGLFGPDLVSLDDVRNRAPDYLCSYGKPPTPQAVGAALERAGAKRLRLRLSLGKAPPGISAPFCDPRQARLVAVRNAHKYLGLAPDRLRAVYWEQRRAVSGGDPDAVLAA